MNDAVRTLLCDVGRQRVLLLIGIEIELAGLGSFYIKGKQICAEVLWQDDASIVFTGFCSLDRIGAVGNDPINIVIAAELREYFIAQIKLQ